jgi:hypothetical protein
MTLPAQVEAQITAMTDQMNRRGFVPVASELEFVSRAATVSPVAVSPYLRMIIHQLNAGAIQADHLDGALAFMGRLAGLSEDLRYLVEDEIPPDLTQYYSRSPGGLSLARALRRAGGDPAVAAPQAPLASAAPPGDTEMQPRREPAIGDQRSDAWYQQLPVGLPPLVRTAAARERAIEQLRTAHDELTNAAPEMSGAERRVIEVLVLPALTKLIDSLGLGDEVVARWSELGPEVAAAMEHLSLAEKIFSPLPRAAPIVALILQAFELGWHLAV